MINYMYNTLLNGGGATRKKLPEGVEDIMCWIRTSLPTVSLYNEFPSVPNLCSARKKATSIPHDKAEAQRYLQLLHKDMTEKSSSGAYSVLDLYGMDAKGVAPVCTFIDRDKRTFQTIGIAQELPVAIWNYAVAVLESALEGGEIDQTLIMQAADLFEWHSTTGEKPGFCHGTLTTIPPFCNANAGRFMYLFCLSLHAYKAFTTTHKNFCSDPKLQAETFWFFRHLETGFRFCFNSATRTACVKLLNYSMLLKHFFFLCDHCLQKGSHAAAAYGVIKEQMKFAEKSDYPDAARMRETLENVESNYQPPASSWLSLPFSVMSATVASGAEDFPVQPVNYAEPQRLASKGYAFMLS